MTMRPSQTFTYGILELSLKGLSAPDAQGKRGADITVGFLTDAVKSGAKVDINRSEDYSIQPDAGVKITYDKKEYFIYLDQTFAGPNNNQSWDPGREQECE